MTVQECLDGVQVFLQVDRKKPQLLDEGVLSLEEAGQVLGGGEEVAVIRPDQADQDPQQWCQQRHQHYTDSGIVVEVVVVMVSFSPLRSYFIAGTGLGLQVKARHSGNRQVTHTSHTS